MTRNLLIKDKIDNLIGGKKKERKKGQHLYNICILNKLNVITSISKWFVARKYS